MTRKSFRKQNPLGKKVFYSSSYDPKLLYRIARPNRELSKFRTGWDRWVSYELSWLNQKGAPLSTALEILVPAQSKYIVESKSLKLYLGSFAFKKFSNPKKLQDLISKDLCSLLESPRIRTKLLKIESDALKPALLPEHHLLEHKDLSCKQYQDPNTDLLAYSENIVSEALCTNSFRSLCPVTGQPDYASIIVSYQGNKIQDQGLLSYLASYRNHGDFHESCCEKIFEDILERCSPKQLTVACYFNRRGGIEINPIRSTERRSLARYFQRLVRQ